MLNSEHKGVAMMAHRLHTCARMCDGACAGVRARVRKSK